MRKTHYKQLRNLDYAGAYLLDPNRDTVVTITKVEQREIYDPENPRNKKLCLVAELKEIKPMVVNSTNGKAITIALGTPYIEEWVGKKIALYIAKIRAFGDSVEALRVRPVAPEPTVKPELKEGTEQFNNAYQAVISGNYTLKEVEKKYILSDKVKQLLTIKSK